mmetsp:Transcript_26598/g.86091  ORF Transcript_26598/g.86091 Transcript_26598/m.86091 type:complete len:362 (-) Transcript_26598:221-1306(-)
MMILILMLMCGGEALDGGRADDGGGPREEIIRRGVREAPGAFLLVSFAAGASDGEEDRAVPGHGDVGDGPEGAPEEVGEGAEGLLAVVGSDVSEADVDAEEQGDERDAADHHDAHDDPADDALVPDVVRPGHVPLEARADDEGESHARADRRRLEKAGAEVPHKVRVVAPACPGDPAPRRDEVPLQKGRQRLEHQGDAPGDREAVVAAARQRRPIRRSHLEQSQIKEPPDEAVIPAPDVPGKGPLRAGHVREGHHFAEARERHPQRAPLVVVVGLPVQAIPPPRPRNDAESTALRRRPRQGRRRPHRPAPLDQRHAARERHQHVRFEEALQNDVVRPHELVPLPITVEPELEPTEAGRLTD